MKIQPAPCQLPLIAEPARLHALLNELLNIVQLPGSDVLFSDVIARFRLQEMPERHSTRVAYTSILRCWIEPHWGSVPVSQIRAADVEQWLATMKCAAKTRQHRKALMRLLFSAAIRWEMISSNPILLARVKGGTKRRRRPFLISFAEFRAVLDELDEPFHCMVLLAGLLGLRASEVVALRWSDTDFAEGTLSVQRASVAGRVADAKTESSEDLLPLDPELIAELLAWRIRCRSSEGDWMFPSPVTGRPYHQDTVRKKHIRPAGVAVGLLRPLGWHTFRHSYRRWLDEAGTPIGMTKELMRHAHISTTMDVYGVGTLTPAKRSAQRAVVELALSRTA